MIYTLCGSTRFPDAFALANMHLSMRGHIVIGLGMFGHVDEPRGARYLTSDGDETTPGKRYLDKLHLRKIDMSDAIYVVNVAGYVGPSTHREIAYARETGKAVAWMFPDAAPNDPAQWLATTDPEGTPAAIPCNNISVGVLVARDDPARLLLIERRQPPFGFAPPAGHVNPGEHYPDAAKRELREEVGLDATDLCLVLRTRRDNRCRRPGGDHHEWQVYTAIASGTPVRSLDETRSLIWAGRAGLRTLAAATRRYLAGGISEDDWQRSPGLEPVWLHMLTELGWIDSPETTS